MISEEFQLDAKSDEIRVIFNNKQIELNDASHVTINYQIDDDEELKDIDETGAVVQVDKIFGYLDIGNEFNGIKVHFNINNSNSEWKIKCSKYIYRNNNGNIYPQEIEINLNLLEAFLFFDKIQ